MSKGLNVGLVFHVAAIYAQRVAPPEQAPSVFIRAASALLEAGSQPYYARFVNNRGHDPHSARHAPHRSHR